MTPSHAPDPPRTLPERVAALEARNENTRWWQNPGWWAVIVSLILAFFTIVWNTKAWEVFEHNKPISRPTVKLIEAHAAAYAQDQWEAEVRVVNATSHNIEVERVTAIFGKASYGDKCDNKGNATRVLYPVSALPTGHTVFERIQPAEGALFRGGPNLDRVFGGKPCPLAVAKLGSPRDSARFTAFTSDGSKWSFTSTLFYQPKARVDGAGGGGLPCLPFLPFLPC